MDPVTAFGVAANAAQFTSLTANVFMKLFQYSRSVIQAPKLSEKLREEVLSISGVLSILESTLKSTNPESGTLPDTLKNMMTEFLQTLTDMSSRITIHDGDLMKRLKWPFTEKENQEYLQKLERFKSTLSLALFAIQNHQNQQIEAGINCIAQDIHQMSLDTKWDKRQEKRFKILEWISDADFRSRHEAISNERAENSGTWLLKSDVYRNWQNGTSSNLLCYQGIPGAGKTFLTSLVIDKINENHQSNTCVAYIYFDYKNSEVQNGDYIIRTLLKQLLLPLDLISPELENIYDDCCSRSRNPDKGFLTSQLLSTAAKFLSVFFIFDALDECSKETLENVITLICQFKNSAIKLFCTFRPIFTDLVKQLGVSDVYTISAQEEDIRNYLTRRLNKEWRHNKRFIPTIIDRLAQGAEGKFLLVKFQLDYVLKKEKPRDAVKALDTLPANMPEAYQEVLIRIDKTNGRQTALQVISWIFHSRRPLKMVEIQEILSIEIQPPDMELHSEYFIDPSEIVHFCQGLVELDPNSEVIRFTHFTVQEFFWKGNQDRLSTPVDLAKVCLTYLTFDIFECSPCPSEDVFNQRMASYRFSDYAVRYWGFYVRGKGEEDPEVLDALVRLFKSPNKCNAIHQHRVWIERPWDPSIWDPSKPVTWTPLHIIAQEGLTTVYNQFVSNGHNTVLGNVSEMGTPNSRDERNNTPLHLAASKRHVEMVALFLEKMDKADVAAKSDQGWTALHWAAFHGHADVVALLLGHMDEADFAAKGASGHTALHLAAVNGHADVVALLLDKMERADVAVKNFWQNTALHRAAERGHRDVVALLLEKMDRADVAAKDQWENTALCLATLRGHNDVVALLLDRMDEADVAAKDDLGHTALHLAAVYGHADVVALLERALEEKRE